MVVGAIGRVGSRLGSRLGSRAASSGIGSRIGSALRTPLGAGAAGFGLGELTDVIGLDLAGSATGEDSGGILGLGNMAIVWVFAGIALLAVVADLSGD